MWTKETLQKTIQERLADYKLIVVSNRQPFKHVLQSGKLVCQREPGGLVTALSPVMEAVHGTWIASSSSEHDKKAVDANSKVMLPPHNPSYQLKRMFLSKEDRDKYYYGFSNEGLWPLCHVAYTRPIFYNEDWKSYQKVNRMFADAVLAEAGNQKAFVWIQDFQLALVAKYLRESGQPNIVTSIFWHIPWPNPEVFRICPQKIEILEGFLSCDLVGFQIRYHMDNFFATVDREVESRIDREKDAVSFQNHEALIRAFPISVDFEAISEQASSDKTQARIQHLRNEYSIGDLKLMVGVDRIDYTKGIPERLRAIDRFLEKYPQYKEKFIFLQIGQISRIHIPRYKHLNDEINGLVEEINWKHSTDSWAPIVLKRTYVSYDDILALYRIADVCIVSSLHDGMNLVSKEFIATREDLGGALILSKFTGASRELSDAILINPYDSEQFADAIEQAFTMPLEEKEKRMRKMREIVGQNNIYRWTGKILSQLLKFEFQEA